MATFRWTDSGVEKSVEIDLSQYACEKCGKMGVTVAGMDVFVGSLCQACFDKLWKEYLEAVMQREVTDEEAKSYLDSY